MDTDHYESAVFVLLSQRTDIRNVSNAVDAGIMPEINEDDFSFELLSRQWRGIDPTGRTGQTK